MKTLYDGTEVPNDTPTKRTARGCELLSNEEVQELQQKSVSPIDTWQQSLAQYDEWIPRPVEDLIDAYGTTNLNAFTLKKYQEKKALRAEKPEG